MINIPKFSMFLLTSLLYFISLCMKVENKIFLTVLYVIFILVGLYDLGKDEIDAETNNTDKV
jgi:hypothetical protein